MDPEQKEALSIVDEQRPRSQRPGAGKAAVVSTQDLSEVSYGPWPIAVG
jgi:hypothetical protein